MGLTIKDEVKIVRNLRKLYEEKLKGTFGEEMARKALEVFEGLYEAELLDDYDN